MSNKVEDKSLSKFVILKDETRYMSFYDLRF